MMTLDEAIKHCKDVALSCTNKECALEHFQLLKWLQEYSNMLEKQEEQKPVEEYNITGISSNKSQGKLGEIIKNLKTTWSEKDEDYINDLIKYFSQNERLKNTKEDIVIWLKSLKDRVQPKQEWSEEDEKMIKALLSICDVYSIKTSFYPKENEDIEKLKNWLKSLKPQNKYVYNPYKVVVESIAEMCKHYDKASHSGLRDFYDNVKIKCKDAKEYDSLYPQNTWKPSDEQMEALEHFIVYHNGSTNYAKDLEELRLQLKKLREE